VEQGIVSLGNALPRPAPPELLNTAGLGDAAAIGVVLEGVGGTEVEVVAGELVVCCWMNTAASEDELVLVGDVVEVVLSGTSI
jgi:hypothetical protein